MPGKPVKKRRQVNQQPSPKEVSPYKAAPVFPPFPALLFVCAKTGGAAVPGVSIDFFAPA